MAFYTLGCKVNQNETGAMEELFRRAGYLVVPPNEAADVFVVNSCTVTAGGDSKSRRALNRARSLNPGVVTVLTGCFPQAFPEGAAKAGADVLCGTARRARLPELVQQFLDTGLPVVEIAPLGRDAAFEALPAGQQEGRTRAFVKVQDGCNRRCAYCIIPTARGPARSRDEAGILAELSQLAAAGYAEVVFTGINLSSYGRDTGTNLAELAQRAAGVGGIERVRLSSLEPDLLPDAQIKQMAQNEKLCPHFHLSLQSGSDAVLRRMRRPYTTALYRDTVAKLRAAMPSCGLTTDLIVGFPGETAAEFDESLAFIREMAFLKVHVFPFSARPGTPAAGMDGQLSKAEKAARATEAQRVADEVRAEWIATQAGSRQRVLLETPLPDGRFTGYTGSYIPVAVHAPGRVAGDILAGVLGSFDGERADFTISQ
ncbi:tRNA (N(6)-L-threonylcarbamoyladenosine(37)-C(2))-methylthiotransferase MtaB [Ruminococcaceae bacterium OttesenSCG-928-D13]|nr:tRNA (N(6)-L-threonylcarbamoyladenosine(37)-C(2))-methylthiotransferase MtaB [Ruminococcaceae bacterium OttesenSCG-928-D13]